MRLFKTIVLKIEDRKKLEREMKLDNSIGILDSTVKSIQNIIKEIEEKKPKRFY